VPINLPAGPRTVGEPTGQTNGAVILKILSLLAKASAILAGLLITIITLVTCVSVMGRNTIGMTLQGDYELTAVTAGAAVALFLPWAQLRRGNIIVDFFTTKLPGHINAMLDRFGALVLATVMLLLAWRTTMGGLNSYSSQTTTMMLGFPEWIVYAAMVPPLCLTGLIALHQAFIGNFKEQDQ
jgi:TRAP-type C4-dicarboxylate transport system permease small subunit